MRVVAARLLLLAHLGTRTHTHTSPLCESFVPPRVLCGSDWSSDVTSQRIKALTDYLEEEQRKENARPKGGATGIKGIVPQAMRPSWDE